MMRMPAKCMSRNSSMLTASHITAWNFLNSCHHARPPKNPFCLCLTWLIINPSVISIVIHPKIEIPDTIGLMRSSMMVAAPTLAGTHPK